MNMTSEEEDQTVPNEIYPSLFDFYNELSPFIEYSMIFAALVVVLNFAIYLKTILNAKKHLSTNLFVPTLILCSLYPLISLAALLTILLPKSWLICHTVMHLSFTLGAVFFHKLCFRYLNSESTYIKENGDEKTIDLKTRPLCCCCSFLPTLKPTKTILFSLKWIIWQMPIVQSGIMITLNVIYYRNPVIYETALLFFIPFLIASIVFGLWSLHILGKMVEEVFPDYRVMRKLKCLQLVLLLCKLQYSILQDQLDSVEFGGFYPLTNAIYKQTFLNLLILLEMILVSVLVHNAYKKPIEV